ncbi:MAG: DUF134 domain-containing protein [Candidatus Omnitrophica bacterium]|nr:DUF134 domain-containing protein [Candidatus Omnitrophota bacterium]
MRGRPKKYRLVRHDPRTSLFSPRGRPGRPDEAILSVDCFEAIHLADFMGQNQKKAAESMRISQQTFSRILRKAHRVIADALVKGKTIKIQGGPYVLTSRETSELKPPNPQ